MLLKVLFVLTAILVQTLRGKREARNHLGCASILPHLRHDHHHDHGPQDWNEDHYPAQV